MALLANPAQEEAIRTIDGPVLIISCPGSGKTTTLVRRIHHMIECGVRPESILMVTFTRDAAEGMAKKYKELFSSNPGVTFATIHSLCFTILKQEGICAPRDFLPEEKKIGFLADFIRNRYRTRDSWEIAAAASSAISVLKNNGQNPDSINEPGLSLEMLTKAYEAYEKWRKESGFVDFDDMLVMCHEALRDNPSMLEKYQNMFRYVQCDEYQDTNFIQRDILYLLAAKTHNLCVVGDDDQSIYAFRGARPEIMLSFNKDFPHAAVIRMGVNYRSAAKIVEASDRLIRNNRFRFKKEFLSRRGSEGADGVVLNLRHPEKKDGMAYLVEQIKAQHEKGVPYKEMAVLFRTNAQAQWPARSLTEAGIPYYSTENVRSIYEGFIFEDIQDYVYLSAGLGDSKRLCNILNHPKRYLFEYHFRECEYTEDAMMDACSYLLKEKGGSWKYDKALDQVAELMEVFGPGEVTLDSDPLDVMDRMNGTELSVHYDKYLREYAEFRGMEYAEVLDMYRAIEEDARKYSTVREWFAAAEKAVEDLHTELKRKDKNGVVITTMHRAKGLEWSAVFIIDADEQITPYKQSVKDAALLEEERRLFYVAMTRAKDTLYVLGSGVASRFISEFTSAPDSQKKSAASAIPEPLQNIPKYFAGKAVEHKRFGKGRVVRYEPGAIVVKFEKSTLTTEKTFTFPETFQSGVMWYL